MDRNKEQSEPISRRSFLRLAKDTILYGGAVTIAGSFAVERVKKIIDAGSCDSKKGTEWLGISSTRPFIVDYRLNPNGEELNVSADLFPRLVNDRHNGIGFEFVDQGEGDWWPYVKDHLGEIRGYAMKGRPEDTINIRTTADLAENNPENEIEIEVSLIADRRIVVKAKDLEGFPQGSQIAIKIPSGTGFWEGIRTFTEGTE